MVIGKLSLMIINTDIDVNDDVLAKISTIDGVVNPRYIKLDKIK